jgi:hypothetical protein
MSNEYDLPVKSANDRVKMDRIRQLLPKEAGILVDNAEVSVDADNITGVIIGQSDGGAIGSRVVGGEHSVLRSR